MYYPNYAQYYNGNQMFPYQAMQQPQSAVPVKDERVWVQGEIGAKAYMVVPGNTVTLWDSESRRIWLKTVNSAGMPMMQEITYNFVGELPQTQIDFEGRLAAIEKRLDALEPKKEETVNE